MAAGASAPLDAGNDDENDVNDDKQHHHQSSVVSTRGDDGTIRSGQIVSGKREETRD